RTGSHRGQGQGRDENLDLEESENRHSLTASNRLHLRVTSTAESLVRAGHPWLFSGSIREQNRAGKTGELAILYDRRDQFLALGFFDAESPIRVRVVHAGKPLSIDD